MPNRFVFDTNAILSAVLLPKSKPRDDKFLSLAISGNANCIVSGDKDLLILNPFRGIPILPPAQFLEQE